MNQQNGVQKILCGVQNYQWGMKGSNSQCLVYKYKKNQHSDYCQSLTTEQDNYAELWMGSHGSLPSIDAITKKSLDHSLPFLFKILSVETALSIQAHPNKQQAELLHQRDPKIYVDNNHKPEMTISLDDFQALSGLAPKEQIIMNVEKNPILIECIGLQLWKEFQQSEDDEKILKQIILRILSFEEETLIRICNTLRLPESNCDAIIDLENQYPNDVGLIFVLFLNHIRLNAGEALVMDAGILHAYLKGNCLECMANSDNVVRAGFTPKLKDKQTLGDIMICSMGPVQKVIPKLIYEASGVLIRQYLTKYTEFSCLHISIENGGQTQIIALPQKAILICTNGSGTLLNGTNSFELQEGQTYYVEEKNEIKLSSQFNLIVFICTSQ